jgi:endonuclease/exonuclease/phosphatase family metal-dependent hydrolase
MLVRPSNRTAFNQESGMNRRYPIAAVIIALASACKQPLDLSPPASGNLLTEQRVGVESRDITVMTQNLYVGADVDLVIRALGSPDPGDDFPALLFAIETVGKTDFPARAEAIADKIARARPHAVGLQEVSQINIDLRPLGVPLVVDQDFLAILQAALAARGLHYQVAATSDNINVNLVSGLVRLRDHDALLIDADRVVINSASGQDFSVNLGEVAAGVVLIRGWVVAHTTIAGQSYTFASAHTEANLAGAPVGLLEQIRAAQVGEMVATIGSSERVVLMGDLNDTPGSPMYAVLAGAGYTDTWTAMHPGGGAEGLTCCHVADLSDHIADFNQRIDYIWTRGFARADGNVQGSIDRFGYVPADLLAGPAYPIWPSDHAGLVAALR